MIKTSKRVPISKYVNRDPALRSAYDQQSSVLEAGRLIKEMREQASLSQAQLAERLGTSQAHISHLERGLGTQGPTFTLLKKVAKACKVNLDITINRPEAESDALRIFGKKYYSVLTASKDRLRQSGSNVFVSYDKESIAARTYIDRAAKRLSATKFHELTEGGPALSDRDSLTRLATVVGSVFLFWLGKSDKKTADYFAKMAENPLRASVFRPSIAAEARGAVHNRVEFVVGMDDKS